MLKLWHALCLIAGFAIAGVLFFGSNVDDINPRHNDLKKIIAVAEESEQETLLNIMKSCGGTYDEDCIVKELKAIKEYLTLIDSEGMLNAIIENELGIGDRIVKCLDKSFDGDVQQWSVCIECLGYEYDTSKQTWVEKGEL